MLKTILGHKCIKSGGWEEAGAQLSRGIKWNKSNMSCCPITHKMLDGTKLPAGSPREKKTKSAHSPWREHSDTIWGKSGIVYKELYLESLHWMLLLRIPIFTPTLHLVNKKTKSQSPVPHLLVEQVGWGPRVVSTLQTWWDGRYSKLVLGEHDIL